MTSSNPRLFRDLSGRLGGGAMYVALLLGERIGEGLCFNCDR